MRFESKVSGLLIAALFLSAISIAHAEDAVCIEDWVCTTWTECMGSNQTRACNDLNFCGTAAKKPEELKSCIPVEKPKAPAALPSKPGMAVCEEKWKCTMWSRCSDGEQARECFDENLCNTLKNKPVEEQRCTQSPAPAVLLEESPQVPLVEQPDDVRYYLFILLGAIIIGISGFLGYSYLRSRQPIQQVPKLHPWARQKSADNMLFDYVDNMKLAGHSNEQIRSELARAGYTGESIDRYLPRENPELRQFSKQMLLKGYNLQQIADHLFTYGYDQQTIDSVKEELSKSRLR